SSHMPFPFQPERRIFEPLCNCLTAQPIAFIVPLVSDISISYFINLALTAQSLASNSLRNATVRSGFRGRIVTTCKAKSPNCLLISCKCGGKCSYSKNCKSGSLGASLCNAFGRGILYSLSSAIDFTSHELIDRFCIT